MEIEILRFHCPGLVDGGRFPMDYTGRGKNLSPEIVLENLSPGAKTLAVTLEDLNHPVKDFTHWVMWNFPARKVIPGGIPQRDRLESGVVQGMAYGIHRYAGPKPPRGRTHVYRFSVYVLDRAITLSPRATKKAFLEKAERYIIQAGSITGEYE